VPDDRRIPSLGAPYARRPLNCEAISDGRSRAARGFRAGIGKTFLVVIIIVVVIGALIERSQARQGNITNELLTPPLTSHPDHELRRCANLTSAEKPASRIVRLSVDDITKDDDGQLRIRLGDPPTPVPEPFASLLLRAANERENMHTATKPDAAVPRPPRRPVSAPRVRNLGNAQPRPRSRREERAISPRCLRASDGRARARTAAVIPGPSPGRCRAVAMKDRS
jgi:hypothetical protein